MELPVTIGLPVEDANDLNVLAAAFTEPPTELESRPFDGAGLAQIVGIIGTGGVPVLIAWIRARAETRKYQTLNAFGIEASGYTVEELMPVLQLMADQESED